MRVLALIVAVTFGFLSVPAGSEAKKAPRSVKAVVKQSVWREPADAKTPLRNLIRSGHHTELHWATFADIRPELERLYGRAHWQPLWLAGGRPTPAATQLIARLAASDSLGLDPADYDATWLGRAGDDLAERSGSSTLSERARFDVGLSVAAIRFVSALDRGRVNPRVAHAQFFIPRSIRAPGAVVDSLRQAELQGGVLKRLQPNLYHYQLLKNALVRYRAMANDSSLATPPTLPKDLKPGMRLLQAARLRRRLTATGDYVSRGTRPPKAKADTLYAADLVDAVKHFQRRHGLEPDGIIWPGTAEELSRPFEENVRKIELTLERWRWLPTAFAAPPIIVNLPAYRLYAFSKLPDREKNAIAMDVLVGAADRNATPVFAAEMTYLVFRPYWEVPTELMVDELGPRAAWDWERLQAQGVVLVSKKGNDSVYKPLTPENLRRIGKDLRMRQLPGPHNALGRVKFMFPNVHDVYLHDTTVGGLFALARRDFSHGCIRVSDPVALAAHVLRNQPEWDRDRIKAAMDGEDNQKINLAKPVPVFIVYGTAGASEAGDVYFYDDVYGLDQELDTMLRKGYPYPQSTPSRSKRAS
jgi:murein L,D-transpeptidase YcbB/YkuD